MICHALAVNLGQQIESSLDQMTVEVGTPQLVLLEKVIGGRER